MEPVIWLSPHQCNPPHAVARPEQVDDLAEEFLSRGWNPRAPALIGYQWGASIQLLSGSHRWAAAVKAGLDKIPVQVVDYFKVHRAYGDLEAWRELMLPAEAGHG